MSLVLMLMQYKRKYIFCYPCQMFPRNIISEPIQLNFQISSFNAVTNMNKYSIVLVWRHKSQRLHI